MTEFAHCACVVLVRSDGYVMTVSRKGKPTDLGLPGGKAEKGETPAQTATRELKEETGLTVDPDSLVKLFTADGDTGQQTITSIACTTFLASSHTGTLKQEEGGGIVSWQPYRALVQNHCTFLEYNSRLFPFILQHVPHLFL